MSWQVVFEGYIPSLHGDAVRIIISESLPDGQYPDYYCNIMIDPVELDAHVIRGIDADQASYLARHYLVTRFAGVDMFDINHQPFDARNLYAG